MLARSSFHSVIAASVIAGARDSWWCPESCVATLQRDRVLKAVPQ
jgi:hypothetical protein